jgi:hypothetical protein
MHEIELLKEGSVVVTYPIRWTDDLKELEKLAEHLRAENAATGWRIVDQAGRLARESN